MSSAADCTADIIEYVKVKTYNMAVPYSLKYTNIKQSDAIETYLEEHLAKLDAVVDDSDTSAQAQIELAKTVSDQQSGDIYRAEINLHSSGEVFYADETANDIYAAIDAMREVIVREVRRTMEKKRDQSRDGARQIKEMLREK
jgi:ribosomal subunit interface protein